jgi:hypothetical protein
MSNKPKYLEQWERVNRWYNRFKMINTGRPHDQPSENYQDDVYAFFLNCYHLKDWIRNDQSTGAAAGKVEKFVENSVELNLCRDICNSIKHLKLKCSKSGKDPRFGRRDNKLDLGGGAPTIAVNYEIQTTTGPIDAFELATKCIRAWESFFESNITVLPQ